MLFRSNYKYLPSDYRSLDIGGGADDNHSDAYGNTIWGDLSDFPSQLVNFNLRGENTLTGDFANLSASNLEVFYLRGRSTVYGNIDTMYAPVIKSFTFIDDLGLATGANCDISNFNSNFSSLTSFRVSGAQNITGSITGLSSTFNNFQSICLNTNLTGVWSDITSTVLTTFVVYGGTSSISGDLKDLPNTINIFQYITTNTTLLTYTPGHTWANPMSQFIVRTGTAMSTTSINNLLVGLAGVPTWSALGGL